MTRTKNDQSQEGSKSAAEKAAKEVLSAVTMAETAVKAITVEVENSGDDVSWCKKFVDEVGVAWSECCDKVKEMGEFQDNYKAAMISPSGNRDLKKQMGREHIK